MEFGLGKSYELRAMGLEPLQRLAADCS